METVFWGLIVTITLFWVSLPFILAAQPKTKSGDFKDADKMAAEFNSALGGYQPSGEEAEIPLNNPPKGGSNVMSEKDLFAEINIDIEIEDLSEECILGVKYSSGAVTHKMAEELGQSIHKKLEKHGIKAPVIMLDDSIELEAMTKDKLKKMKHEINSILQDEENPFGTENLGGD